MLEWRHKKSCLTNLVWQAKVSCCRPLHCNSIKVLYPLFIHVHTLLTTASFTLSVQLSPRSLRSYRRLYQAGMDAQLSRAVEAYRAGGFKSIQACAVAHKVERRTLSRRLQGATSRQLRANKGVKLTREEEEAVVQHLVRLYERGIPAKFSYIALVAVKLIDARSHSSRTTPAILGKHWTYRFVKRHPEVKALWEKPSDVKKAHAENREALEDGTQHQRDQALQRYNTPESLDDSDRSFIELHTPQTTRQVNKLAHSLKKSPDQPLEAVKAGLKLLEKGYALLAHRVRKAEIENALLIAAHKQSRRQPRNEILASRTAVTGAERERNAVQLETEEQPQSPAAAARPRSRRLCALCRAPGHTRRTCEQRFLSKVQQQLLL